MSFDLIVGRGFDPPIVGLMIRPLTKFVAQHELTEMIYSALHGIRQCIILMLMAISFPRFLEESRYLMGKQKNGKS